MTISKSRSQVIIIILTRQGQGSGLVHLLGVLCQQVLVDLGRGRGKSRGGDKFLGI